MTAEKRPLPGTGEIRPLVFRHKNHGETGVVSYGLWTVLFKSEIRYATGDWKLAIYFALALCDVYTGDPIA